MVGLLWSKPVKDYPDLKIALSEGDTGWIPYFPERVDRTFEMHTTWTLQDFGGKLPSEVFREHFLICFISDPLGVRLRHEIGIDNICWEADYPHSDSMWPGAPEELGDVLKREQMPDDEINKMTHRNAIGWYLFDPFAYIGELILVGDIKDEERLPPLDTLIKQFGVSAPTMREALRILEAEDLITVRRGSVGGAIVQRPTPKAAVYTLALALRSQGKNRGDVAEASGLLEPLCAMLCALRLSRKSKVVREFRKANAAARTLSEDGEVAFNECMAEFHTLLVHRCGNDTIKLVVGGTRIDLHARCASLASLELRVRPLPDAGGDALAEHEHITDLIEAGDANEVAIATMDPPGSSAKPSTVAPILPSPSTPRQCGEAGDDHGG